MVHDRLADRCAGAHHEVEHPRRQTCLRENVRDDPRTAGRPLSRLEDHGVAVRQRRRDFPRWNRDRKIPRRNQPDDPNRLAGDFDFHTRPHGRYFLARQTERFAGEEFENLSGTRGFTDAFR